MLKKTIKYTDFNGTEREEDFFFNLTQAEITEMELSKDGGLAESIKKIVAAQNAPAIVKIFKEIILKAYGEKSDDGRRFMKKDKEGYPLANQFEETEAYSILFTELSSDADAASKFINGIVPANYQKEANKALHPANK